MTDQHPGFEAGDDSQTSPKAVSNDDLHQRVAAAVWERQNPGRRWADCEYRWRADAEEDAAAALTALKPELDRLAEYENTITWMATCTSCARILDSSIRETERAERAEQERDLLARTIAATSKQTVAQVLADARAALDTTAGTTATQATDEPALRKAPPPRDCLFARDGARPCPTSDRCATCDPKEQPDA